MRSSQLGRIFSGASAGRMVQRGLRVTEMKLRDNLVLHREQGRVAAIARGAGESAGPERARARGGHVRSVGPRWWHISLKLVNPVGNQVIAAHNYAVPADENVRTLLAGR